MKFLLGSSLLPSSVSIGASFVQLGDVVRRAQRMSGLTIDEWNAIAPLKREAHLALTVYAMRDEAEKHPVSTASYEVPAVPL